MSLRYSLTGLSVPHKPLTQPILHGFIAYTENRSHNSVTFARIVAIFMRTRHRECLQLHHTPRTTHQLYNVQARTRMLCCVWLSSTSSSLLGIAQRDQHRTHTITIAATTIAFRYAAVCSTLICCAAAVVRLSSAQPPPSDANSLRLRRWRWSATHGVHVRARTARHDDDDDDK